MRVDRFFGLSKSGNHQRMTPPAKIDLYASPLADRLRHRISSEGPITFCDWMRMALYDEEEGYYCRTDRQRWGRAGDYRTSPERSSLFAATFARYFARLYDELGRPRGWTIAEVGAGDGRFAGRVLETLQTAFPSVFAATRYVVDEASSHSRSLARGRLEPFIDRVEFRRLGSVELDPGIIFSNELLDAFPVHRVAMRDGQLREFHVTVGADGEFQWTLDDPSTPRLARFLEQGRIYLAEGQVTEINLEIGNWLSAAAKAIKAGYLITVEYGANAEELYSSVRCEGTLRCFSKHQMRDNVLAHPGEQDLTTTVDWSFVKRTGETLGLEVTEFNRQDKFLISAGLLNQLETEAQRIQSEAARLRLSTTAREMILPDGMAAHFQVLVQKKKNL
jgi:SAM-dependent MidA family methyltransferase